MNALEMLVKKARNDFEMTLLDVMLDPQDEENTCYLINGNQMKKLRKSFNALAEVIEEMENPMEKTVSLEYYVNNIKVTRKEYIADFTAGAKHNLGAGRDIAKEFIGHDESQALNYGYSMFQFDTGGLFEIKRLLK